MKTIALILGILTLQTALHARPLFFAGLNAGALATNKYTKPGIAGGAEIGLETKYFGAAVQGYGMTGKTKSEYTDATISLAPVMLAPYFVLPVHSSAGKKMGALRLGAGIGYVLAHYKLGPDVDDELNQGVPPGTTVSYKASFDNGIGYQVGGGFDVHISRNFTIGTNINYLIFRTNAHETLEIRRTFSRTLIESTSEVNLDSLVAMASIKYYF